MRFPTIDALLGAFLIITSITAQAALPNAAAVQGFSFSSVSNRILTPHGKNRTIVFIFSNPQFSDVTGRIFDLHGGLVATMAQGPNPNTTLQWDGRSNNVFVPSGVYLYSISAEGSNSSGAVVVIR